jgi:hypothetical protein
MKLSVFAVASDSRAIQSGSFDGSVAAFIDHTFSHQGRVLPCKQRGAPLEALPERASLTSQSG